MSIDIDAREDIEVKDSTSLEVEVESNKPIDVEEDTSLEVTASKKEYTISGDDTYIPSKYEDAPEWLQNIIDDTINVALETERGKLNKTVESLNSLVQELEVAKNTYAQSIISQDTIDNRINTAITTLNSNMAQADATILDIAQTAVTPDEARATVIDGLNSELESEGSKLNSSIAGLQQTFVDANEATATSIESLESSLDSTNSNLDANATAVDNLNTYVGLDETGASNNTGLSAYLESSDGIVGGADSNVANSVYVDSQGTTKSKWEYNSALTINGVSYTSGFGLATSATPNSGLTGSDSEFWIKADKFRLQSADQNAVSPNPFTVDGSNGDITFNGKVSFNSVTNKPTHTSGASNPIGTAIEGSTYRNTTDDSFWSYTDGRWVQGGNPDAITAEDLSATGTTVIDGGRITTGTIDADRLDVNSIFSKNITYTGVITGGNTSGGGIIQSYNGNMVINLVEGSIYIS